ncbi:MAG: long-chain-fatty-acid--CoA ligase [Corynebacterium sp.]|nr:long-chain-fatty-acid--CoA ligase [Corynebacterium sp.]
MTKPAAPWLSHYAEWTPQTLDYGQRTLVDNYLETVAQHPRRVATYFFGRTRTYAELDAQVRRAAAGLRALGVAHGDRVVIALPNCPQAVMAYHAVLLLGATAVMHNPLYTASELEMPWRNHRARVAIVWDKAASTFMQLRDTTPLETVVSVNLLDEMPPLQRFVLDLPLGPIKKQRAALTAPALGTLPWSMLVDDKIGGIGESITQPKELNSQSTALILYTSGTTGQPKGAQLTHGNLMANLLQVNAWVPGLGASDERVLGVLPFFHAYGLVGLNVAISCGAELVLLPAPQLPLIMKVMKKRRPTFFPGVPTLYQRIIEEAVETGQSIAGIRNSFSGAATLPVDLVEQWEMLSGGVLVEGYGLTETSPVIVGNPMDGSRRAGSVGLPFPDTQIRIANPEDVDQDVPLGQEGEVLVRGPQVFPGYFEMHEATATAFHDGWFRTGDIGVMDEQGFITLVSRLKEMIITGGFNVYPAEVEGVLQQHPDIVEAGVVGIPREDGSESVVAAITLAPAAIVDPVRLKEFCRRHLARYKVPRVFYHFEQLPKDQLGKIRRRDIVKQLQKSSIIGGE